jgi:pimeloyl-ACP methyl ester carboxylesterase
MHIVLVPGLWLDASSWSDVARRLTDAGHKTTALTLRGLDSRTSDRSGIMLADHVAEIVAAIDRCDGSVMLVAHAESGGLVHAAVTRRPGAVTRAVYVGGFPSADGAGVLSGFTADAVGRPTHTGGQRAIDASLAALHRRVTENGVHVLDGMQRLSDERRFGVPVTVVATEFTSEDARRWMAAGVDPARELARIADVTLVDLPSGRWTHVERPADLSALLLEAASAVPPSATGGGSVKAWMATGSMLSASTKA